jgi:uncharacterized protein YegP (UPF0339 family)
MTKTAMQELVSDTMLNLFLLKTHQYDEYRFAEAMKTAEADYYLRLRVANGEVVSPAE